MQKKEETPMRKARRKYEQVNKEYRDQATKQFNTLLQTKQHDKISAFLKEHNITKVDLIYAGFQALQNQYGPQKQLNNE